MVQQLSAISHGSLANGSMASGLAALLMLVAVWDGQWKVAL